MSCRFIALHFAYRAWRFAYKPSRFTARAVSKYIQYRLKDLKNPVRFLISHFLGARRFGAATFNQDSTVCCAIARALKSRG